MFAGYEAITNKNPHINNIMMHFGDHLRHVFNILTTKEELKNGYPKGDEIDLIYEKAKAFRKQIITATTTQFYKDVGFGATTRRVLFVLAPVLNAYPPSTAFYEGD
ncbi:hypothetical protein BX667DRAFT_504919 [Coemansia mojavensis]|nr:hypothetical protein BX667DRAFT_504919 [Coemansia mojavensis]